MQALIGFCAFIALLFGCAAYLAVQAAVVLCARITPFADGPKTGRPPTWLLIGGSAAIGAMLAYEGANLPQLGIGAVLVAALAAAWYSDVRTGIVPDQFTMIPLVLFLGVAVIFHEYGRVLTAFAVTLPFILAAVLSRGRGMGWADVKLAGLGAVALGWQQSVAALAVACGAAAAVATVRRRKNEPIAFVPYIAGAIAVAMTFSIF